MKIPPFKSSEYDCVVCRGHHKRHDGDVIVCVQAIDDPNGDRELNGKKVRFEGRGVCLSCLLSNEMDEIMAAYHQKFASTVQADPVIECTIAEAKAKVDASFCLEDYLEERGLSELHEDEPPRQCPSRKVDEHGIREVEQPRGANCGNCATRMETGTWRCPAHGVDVDAKHICDRYRPGLR